MKNKLITYTPPPDKSITIRALVLSSLRHGKTTILNPLYSDDTYHTIKTLKKLGVKIKKEKERITIESNGKYNFKSAKEINVGESALLLNLILPVLSNQKHTYYITGKKTILKRNFKNTLTALIKLGAKIEHNNFKLPFKVYPSELKKGTFYTTSAQTKSSLLIASIYGAKVKIIEKIKTRNHTELMLKHLGYRIRRKNNEITLEKETRSEKNIVIKIPNDISQSAVFITLAILKKLNIKIKNCGINPTRTGFLMLLKKAGYKIKYTNTRTVNNEKTADIIIKNINKPKPVIIQKNEISTLIDEIFPSAVILSKSYGKSVIEGLEFVINKESNRFKELISLLKKLGIKYNVKKFSLYIYHTEKFKKVNIIDTKGDHRIAMIAGILKSISGGIKIINKNCVRKTYPGFWKDLNSILKAISKI